MSSIDLVARYLAERGRPRVLVPLGALLAVAGWLAGSSPVSASRLLAATANAYLWILAFRVWDDLEDRERDTREHPGRVMTSDRRTAPFVLLAALLVLAEGTLVALSDAAVARGAILVAAAFVLFCWYRLRGDSESGVVGGHVVLIKYPAIALAIAPVFPSMAAPGVWRPLAVITAAYLVICIYESFDDPRLRASKAARGVAIAELVLLVPLVAATLTSFGAGKP